MNKLRFAALVFVVCLSSCKKDNSDTPSSPNRQAISVNVVIDQNSKGYIVPHVFEGLSYETALLSENPDYLNESNTVLVQLIKNLGHGVLRIGGNSSDIMGWSRNIDEEDRRRKAIGPADIDRLRRFAKAIDWPVLFGLNLANNNAKAAADEAGYVHNSLRNSLYAFQSGNEPDAFPSNHRPKTYSYPDYQRDWERYYNSVKSVAPAANFAGPDIDPFNIPWLSNFTRYEHAKVNLIDAHYYNNGPASDPKINLNDLLYANKKMNEYLAGMSTVSSLHGLPYRISEGNNIWGQGKPGLSNSFASALWALDFMWSVAENRGQGINFHGGGIGFNYTPINVDEGIVTARPEYYGMLAFKYGAIGGRVILASVVNHNDNDNYSVHAVINQDKSTSITLINKEPGKDFSFIIQLDHTVSNLQVDRLTAPGITALNGVTFAGSAVNADGSFTPAAAQVSHIDQKRINVVVPAGSAAVVKAW